MTDQLKLVRIRDRNVPRIHEHKLLDDEASLASLSLQERDGIGWLMLRGAILLKHKKIVFEQPAHIWQWPLSKKFVTLTPNLSNLIATNPVLG